MAVIAHWIEAGTKFSGYSSEVVEVTSLLELYIVMPAIIVELLLLSYSVYETKGFSYFCRNLREFISSSFPLEIRPNLLLSYSKFSTKMTWVLSRTNYCQLYCNITVPYVCVMVKASMGKGAFILHLQPCCYVLRCGYAQLNNIIIK